MMGRREDIREGLALYCDDVDGAIRFLHTHGVVIFIDGNDEFPNEGPYHPEGRVIGCTGKTEPLIEVDR